MHIHIKSAENGFVILREDQGKKWIASTEQEVRRICSNHFNIWLEGRLEELAPDDESPTPPTENEGGTS